MHLTNGIIQHNTVWHNTTNRGLIFDRGHKVTVQISSISEMLVIKVKLDSQFFYRQVRL